MRQATCAGNAAARAATRSTLGGAGCPAGGRGLVGVLVFVAFQLLSGGSGFAVPSAFDDGAQAPGGGSIPADQDPERDLRDFSEYVFDSTQSTWAKRSAVATATPSCTCTGTRSARAAGRPAR